MLALAGASQLLHDHRPALAVEVDQLNETAFWKWAALHGYRPIGAFFDYIQVRNYLLIPT